MHAARYLVPGLTLALALSSGAVAQQLVRDITPGQVSQDSSIGQALASGTQVFFTADIGRGSELFVTDGGASGTHEVLDIRPGSASSGVSFGADLNGSGTILFSADDGVHGFELWRSDGTAPGTFMVADINLGGDSSPRGFWQLGGVWYFAADDGIRGFELWRTDGTTAGTTLALEFNPGPGDGVWFGATVIQNQAFLSATDGTTGFEPWVTDGTPSGTARLADINPRDASPHSFTQVSGTILFAARNASGDEEIWKTDGTPGGTSRVIDLATRMNRPYVSQARSYNGSMAFSTRAGIWICDGTAAGTVRLFSPTPYWSTPRILGELNGSIWFAGNLGLGPSQLWSTDGTIAGTTQVAAPAGGINPFHRSTVLNNKLHFVADDGLSGPELWESDGTSSGTRITADIWPGPSSSTPPNDPMLLTDWPAGGLIVMRAQAPDLGTELWMSGGTAASTFLVDDILPASGESTRPHDITPIGDDVYFTATTTSEGFELWTSDGTAAGTRIVADLNPGSSGSQVDRLTAFDGSLYFTANDGTLERLWVTDGTTAGTTPIANVRVSSEIVVFDGCMYFGAESTSAQGQELWCSDGTPAGTARLADITPGLPGSYPSGFTVVGDQLFFRATQPGIGYELHVTDGTAAGTRLVREVRAGSFHGGVGNPTAYGDTLMFTANDGSGDALWRSDGTAAGTTQVYDFSAVPNGRGRPDHLMVWNGLLYFRADDGGGLGSELWQSDGTAAGTRVAADIVPGLSGSAATPRFVTSEFLYLTAFAPGETTAQLWTSDGTSAGTVKLTGINPSDQPYISGLVGFGPGPKVLFSATDVPGNAELWTSDGTPSGTAILAELNDFGGSAPHGFALAGRTIFFSATEHSTGDELWSMDVSAFGGSLATPYGQPCAGSSVVPPQLDAPRAARVGEASFALAVQTARQNSAATVLLGGRRQSLPLGGGCELLVDGIFASVSGVTGPTGTASWTIPIANDPVLVGFDFACQGAVADPMGALGVFALTDGLRIVVGS